jgi:hypothetical protein
MLQYTMKVLLSVAIVAMVKSDPKNATESQQLESDTGVEQGDVCPVHDSTSSSSNQVL